MVWKQTLSEDWISACAAGSRQAVAEAKPEA